MFRLMRNIHLILGLVFFFYALIFAVSSLAIIYRPWLGMTPTDTEQTLAIPAEQANTPRALAHLGELLDAAAARGADDALRRIGLARKAKDALRRHAAARLACEQMLLSMVLPEVGA